MFTSSFNVYIIVCLVQATLLVSAYIIQIRLKKLEYQDKGQSFLSLISTHILYRFITYRVKYFKPLFLEIFMIMDYRYWKHKIQCFRKFEYYIRSIKKWYFKQKYQASEKYVHLYALNTWLGLLFHELLHQWVWHGGNQSVALLRWYGSPGCFDSGLQVICIVGSGVSHLPLDNNP